MEPVLPVDLELPPRGSGGRLRVLHARLREHILAGRLGAGLRLPSTRRLAQALGISRNTAIAAYELLAGEGYVVTTPAGGSFVARLPVRAPPGKARTAAEGDARLAPAWRHRRVPQEPPAALRFDFSLGVPDKTLFPFDIWRRLSARALRQLSARPAAYAEPQGRPALREAIARHVSFSRAVACTAQDLVVTAGAQQAFGLIARVLVTPGRTVVAVEDPGYPPLRRAFEAAGAVVHPVACDAQGLRVDRLPEAARIVCVTPSHQFPLGMAMSAQRRAELLAFARARPAVIVEDDYDGEFRYGGRPLDALQTLDRDESVFYVGTFSKSLFPGLRLGYAIVPAWARAALAAAKREADWHCGLLQQDTLAAFIEEGHLARHVRRARRAYGERRARLLAALAREAGGLLQPVPSEAGLHLSCALDPAIAAADAVARAAEAGVPLAALSSFTLGPSPLNGLALGFGRLQSADVDEAVRRLGRALA